MEPEELPAIGLAVLSRPTKSDGRYSNRSTPRRRGPDLAFRVTIIDYWLTSISCASHLNPYLLKNLESKTRHPVPESVCGFRTKRTFELTGDNQGRI